MFADWPILTLVWYMGGMGAAFLKSWPLEALEVIWPPTWHSSHSFDLSSFTAHLLNFQMSPPLLLKGYHLPSAGRQWFTVLCSQDPLPILNHLFTLVRERNLHLTSVCTYLSLLLRSHRANGLVMWQWEAMKIPCVQHLEYCTTKSSQVVFRICITFNNDVFNHCVNV